MELIKFDWNKVIGLEKHLDNQCEHLLIESEFTNFNFSDCLRRILLFLSYLKLTDQPILDISALTINVVEKHKKKIRQFTQYELFNIGFLLEMIKEQSSLQYVDTELEGYILMSSLNPMPDLQIDDLNNILLCRDKYLIIRLTNQQKTREHQLECVLIKKRLLEDLEVITGSSFAYIDLAKGINLLTQLYNLELNKQQISINISLFIEEFQANFIQDLYFNNARNDLYIWLLSREFISANAIVNNSNYLLFVDQLTENFSDNYATIFVKEDHFTNEKLIRAIINLDFMSVHCPKLVNCDLFHFCQRIAIQKVNFFFRNPGDLARYSNYRESILDLALCMMHLNKYETDISSRRILDFLSYE